jgi:non-specific serine/threonine protein kinase
VLVAPASLLANWTVEIARFAPSLKAVVAHPSAPPVNKRKMDGSDDLSDVDLVITSYGYLARAPWLETTPWRLVVVDEAQAI